MEDYSVVYDRLVSKATGTKLDIKELLNNVKSIQQIMGEDWLTSETVKAKKGGLRSENMHRFIYLLGCYNAWCEQCVKTGRMTMTLEMIELIKLCTDLKMVKKVKNYENKFIKLRISEEFASTVFEIEIAVAHLNVGNDVAFVNESQSSKTPDLEIKTKKGFTFYLECKAKVVKSIAEWKSLGKYIKRQIRDSSHQFTLGGPGILCLKFPYIENLKTASIILKKSEAYTRLWLKPHEKRSINQVNMLVPTYQKIKKGTKIGFAYHPARVTVKHPNPSCKLPG